MEECLDDDPAVRPTIATVCERIQVSKDVYMKEAPQNVIGLYQQVEQQRFKIKKLSEELEIENKRNNKQLRAQMVLISYKPISYKYYLIWYNFASPPQGVYQHNK